ncbi:hypothetical protein NGM37_50235, partial [Streptomyces sp. TRM76130]|nr:hypothetical protein [Streptomyces sp. TRM76130]
TAAGAGASVGLVPGTRAPDRLHDDRAPLRAPGPEALARVADALAGPLPRAAARALAADASAGAP